MTSTIENIAVRKFDSLLGAEVQGVDLNASLSERIKELIRFAWYEHQVLLFRNQNHLTTKGLVDFSRMFGELDAAPITATNNGKPFISEFPQVTAISNIEEGGKPIGGLGYGEAEWHTDMSYKDVPPSASVLFSIEIPPTGGDTYFTNMYAAYDALPGDLKHRVHAMQCVHDASRNSAGQLRKGFKDVSDPRETVGAWHPLVRTHAITRKDALYLGRRKGAYIKGLSLEESDALLDVLWQYATSPAFTWAQKWRVGDVLIWDNSCTMHRRDSFDPNHRRLMHRTQIAGDKPFLGPRAVGALAAGRCRGMS
jgi:taurine dioxygenase